MRWSMVRRVRERTAEAVLAVAWNTEIDAMRGRKTSPDPGLIPYHHWGAESAWHVDRCVSCGATYDEHAQRFRARVYEALTIGD